MWNNRVILSGNLVKDVEMCIRDRYNSIPHTYLRLDSFISILILLLNSILLVILILNLYIF